MSRSKTRKGCEGLAQESTAVDGGCEGSRIEWYGFDGKLMCRENDAWIKELRSEGPEQQAALAELRDRLMCGLRGALSTRPAIDDAFLEDAVQDSLIRILERLEQFEGRSRFLTWATSIAIREAMRELRRRRWKDVSLEALVSDREFSSEAVRGRGQDAEQVWEQEALLERMHWVIRNELTERQRTALLAELRGMPQEEIARHLGTSRNAIYKLTHDARRRLKRGLESAGFAAADVRSAFRT